MAFPSSRSEVVTNGTTASASPVINLPATVKQNDVLLVVFRVAVGGAIGWPTGWTEMFDASSDAADDQMAAAWKRAEGNEGGTTITLSCTSGKFAAVAYAIRDSADPHVRAPELSTVATGTSANPNATTVTPTGGAKDYCWLTFTGREGEATLPPTYPTNYSVAQLTADSGTASTVGTNVRVSGAIRTDNNAASEDAGQWTFSDSEDWTAYTIAFHPPPADPAPGVNKVTAPVSVIRPLAAAAAIAIAFVPVIQAAPEPAWLPPTPRIVLRAPRLIPSELVLPLLNLPGPAAGSAADTTGSASPPRSVVHYTSIAGPVVVAPELPWITAPPGLVPRIFSVPSVVVAPLFQQPAPPAATAAESSGAAQHVTRGPVHYVSVAGPVVVPSLVAPDRPAQFNDDGLIRPDRWVHYQEVGAPVAIPLTTGWWPAPLPPVRPLLRPLESVVAAPLFQQPAPPSVLAVDTSGAAQIVQRGPVHYVSIAGPVAVPPAAAPTIPWLPAAQPLILATRPTRSLIVMPPTVPAAGVPAIPWLPPVQPLVLPRWPVRHVLVLPPTVPPAAMSGIPWLPPAQPLILPRWPVRSALVMPPTVPATGAPTLPWLPAAQPLILPRWPVRHVLALPPTATGIPWFSPTLPLVVAPRPVRDTLVIPIRFDQGVPAFPLTLTPPVVRRLVSVASRIAAPVITDPAAMSTLPWLMPPSPPIRAPWPVCIVVALPPTVPAAPIVIIEKLSFARDALVSPIRWNSDRLVAPLVFVRDKIV
jgi:hypothetical protein